MFRDSISNCLMLFHRSLLLLLMLDFWIFFLFFHDSIRSIFREHTAPEPSSITSHKNHIPNPAPHQPIHLFHKYNSTQEYQSHPRQNEKSITRGFFTALIVTKTFTFFFLNHDLSQVTYYVGLQRVGSISVVG